MSFLHFDTRAAARFMVTHQPAAATALTLAAALAGALMAATSAYAEDETQVWLAQHPSTKSRAEVMAEFDQARRDGTIHAWDPGYQAPFHSTKTREEVRAEVTEAFRSQGALAVQADELTPAPGRATVAAPVSNGTHLGE